MLLCHFKVNEFDLLLFGHSENCIPYFILLNECCGQLCVAVSRMQRLLHFSWSVGTREWATVNWNMCCLGVASVIMATLSNNTFIYFIFILFLEASIGVWFTTNYRVEANPDTFRIVVVRMLSTWAWLCHCFIL